MARNDRYRSLLRKSLQVAEEARELPDGAELLSLSDDEFVERFGPFCDHVVEQVRRTFRLGPRHKEELRAEAMLGLVDARGRYDPATGAFSTYAYHRVRGQVLDGVRRLNLINIRDRARARLMRLQSEMGGSSEQGVTIAAVDMSTMAVLLHRAKKAPPGPDKLVEERHRSEALLPLLDELKGGEREVIRMFYFEDISLSDIARHLDRSPSWVSRLHRRALARIRQKLTQHQLADI